MKKIYLNPTKNSRIGVKQMFKFVFSVSFDDFII